MSRFFMVHYVLIKCYKHSQKQLKRHLVNDNSKCNVFYDRRRTDYSHNFSPVLGV